MNRKQITSIGLLISAFLLFAACGWLFYRYFKRWARIRAERDIVVEMRKELAEYKQLGFGEDSELVAILSKRLYQQKQKKRAIKQQWFMVASAVSEQSRLHLQRLFDLNRKMLMGYIHDVQEYKKRGIPSSDPLVRFSYDKMVRLTIALSELERQINTTMVDGEFSKRLRRMQEITKQSIMQCKDRLLACADDEQRSVREQLTRRIRELDQLERISL
jgi:hypothetical protein